MSMDFPPKDISLLDLSPTDVPSEENLFPDILLAETHENVNMSLIDNLPDSDNEPTSLWCDPCMSGSMTDTAIPIPDVVMDVPDPATLQMVRCKPSPSPNSTFATNFFNFEGFTLCAASPQQPSIPQPISSTVSTPAFSPQVSTPQSHVVTTATKMNPTTTTSTPNPLYRTVPNPAMSQLAANPFFSTLNAFAFPALAAPATPVSTINSKIKTEQQEEDENNSISSIVGLETELIRLVEGYNVTPKREADGGRGNKTPLPKQIVEIDMNKLRNHHLYQKLGKVYGTLSLKVKVFLMKIDKDLNQRVSHGSALSEAPVIFDGKCYLATFDHIVLQEASRFNGGKFYLRFTLVMGNSDVAYVDSAEFQTITERGKKKRCEKEKDKGHSSARTYVDCVNPPIGRHTGGDFVKVFGQGFHQSTPVPKVVVKFGNMPAREVFVLRRNVIICETPEMEVGSQDKSVEVTVSFDSGKTFFSGGATYRYVDPDSAEDVLAYLRQNLGMSSQHALKRHFSSNSHP